MDGRRRTEDGGRRTDGKPQGWVERVFWIPHLARSDSYTNHAFSRHSRILLSQIIQTVRVVCGGAFSVEWEFWKKFEARSLPALLGL